MSEYRPNSHVSKEQPERQDRRAEKIVTGEARTRRKGVGGKLGSIFMPGDVNSVKSYIFMDVLVPSIKRAISDIVCNGVNMLLGESSRGSSGNSPARKVSYRQYYNGQSDDRAPIRASRGVYDYDEIIFDNRGDAEEVLFRMEEILSHFDTVSVAEMFDMAGITCEYTANKYGWTDLRNARVVRTSDGYVIDLPRAVLL